MSSKLHWAVICLWLFAAIINILSGRVAMGAFWLCLAFVLFAVIVGTIKKGRKQW